MTTRIITGLQATGTSLHIGNYLGAIKPLLEAQKRLTGDDHLYIFVPDLHSFTTSIDHSTLYQRVIDNVRMYIASGIKMSSNTTLFRQSHVSQHAELTWALSCFSYFGELSRMTQFKDKSQSEEQKGSSNTVGLFTYPVLMAADILLYDIEYVPVGDDQKQHLELARDIAIRMNNRFEKEFPDGLFVIPRPWAEQLEFSNVKNGLRIKSLQNPEKKMSKSVTDPKGTILLTDDPKDAVKKIMSATTDDQAYIRYNFQTQLGITNLLQIYQLFSNKTEEQVLAEFEGHTQYGEFKKTVAGVVESFLIDFQSKLANITDELVIESLNKGEEEARSYASGTLSRVYRALGLTK